jgi:DNA-binding response OmpR family regulator
MSISSSNPSTSADRSSERCGQAAVQSAPGPYRARKRVLLVDDDPAVRDSLGNVLVSEGYQVVPAENGEQALELANKVPVDLALLDLNMPVKNGWATFEELIGSRPLLPVIIITARANQVFTALSAGAGALMEKPMDIEALLNTMTALLNEPAEQRLARLVGKSSRFHYKPAKDQEHGETLRT